MSKGPKGISQFAYTFIIAADRCSIPRPLPDGKLEMPLIPGLICRAFSIELNFKAIIAQQGASTRGHKLYDLYYQINEPIKSEILKKSNYDEHQFDNKLKQASETFVKWRYLYEEDSLHCDLNFLKILSEAAQDISKQICQ